MRGAYLRRLGVIAVAIILALSLLALAKYLHTKGVTWAVNASTIAAAFLAGVTVLAPALASLMRWARGPAPLTRTSVGQARDDLAHALAREWAEEERFRRVNDPYPLPVRWEITPTSVADAQPGGSSGEFAEILGLFMRLPSPPRMVVLGSAGAGKSVLAIRLARDLLSLAPPSMPVPVIVSATAWDTDTRLEAWVASQLCLQHPGLARRVKDTTGRASSLASALVADGMVMPIVDGLDELPVAQRHKAIEKINEQGSDTPLVVTCRPDEYAEARDALGRGISRSVVVEVMPLRAGEVRQYLSDATAIAPAQRWREVFRHLDGHPDGPLAQVLRTPLMLWLARTIYEQSSSDPGELTDRNRFGSVEALEDHLLGALVPAVYTAPARDDSHRFQCSPEQASRWLGFLAAHLEYINETDFVWWQLCRAARSWRVFCCALRGALLATTSWLITKQVLDLHGYWRGQHYVRRTSWQSLVLNGPIGKQARPVLDQLFSHTAHKIHHGLHTFMTSQSSLPWRRDLPWISFPQFEFTVAWISLFIGIILLRHEAVPKPRVLIFWPLHLARHLTTRLMLNCALIAALMLLLLTNFQVPGHAVDPTAFFRARSTWYAILVCGALWTLGSKLWRLLIASLNDSSPILPQINYLSLDRRTMWYAGTLRVSTGTLMVWLWAGTELAVAYCVFTIAIVLSAIVLGSTAGANQMYVMARVWLYVSGRAPWRFTRFLADSYRSGVLRRVGVFYEFRHIRLQERLAHEHPLRITRAEDWIRRKLLRLDDDAAPGSSSLIYEILNVLLRDLWTYGDVWALEHGLQVTVDGKRGRRIYRDRRFDVLRRTDHNSSDEPLDGGSSL